MAGLRCGFAIAKPELLEKLKLYGEGFLPSPAMAAAIVSLKDPDLVPERRKANAATRDDVMAWLNKKGYATTPSQSNCFMVDVKRPGGEVAAAMATHKVYIGRSWPVWPNWARITVGTPAEMEKFKHVFSQVMA
jgi:histidinol-phosphate aminotransferase